MPEAGGTDSGHGDPRRRATRAGFDPQRAWPLFWTTALAVVVAMAVVAASLTVAIRELGLSDRASLRANTPAVLDLVKLAFALVAGIGATIGLVLTYRRHRMAENVDAWERDRAGREERREAREETRLLNERFSAAAAQLASDQAGLRIAGAYSMAQLADDWDDGRQQCIDVLCAHVRRERPDPATTEAQVVHDDREFRLTITRLITVHLKTDDAHSWRDRDFDFTGATFDGEEFKGAVLDGGTMSFNRARFMNGGADLFEIRILGGLLDFRRADFTGSVRMELATIAGGAVDFSEARFSGGRIDLRRIAVTGSAAIYFCRARFESSELDFTDAGFAGGVIDFRDATFDGGHFEFGGADLLGTEFAVDGGSRPSWLGLPARS
jgi:uncharacterized protein YjbI with pentapeptide repeats